MWTMFAALRLCLMTTTAFPHVPIARVAKTSMAIEIAKTRTAQPGNHVWRSTLIAAIAQHESDFKLDEIGSRQECGPMQVKFGDRDRAARCAAARADYVEAYVQGITRLNVAAKFCAKMGRPTEACALRVFASGPRGWQWRNGEAVREFYKLEGELRDALQLVVRPAAS